MPDPFPLSVLNGDFDGLLPDFSQEFLVRDALWPSYAHNLTETGINEDLQLVVGVLSLPPGFCPVLENWFDIADE